MNIFKILISSLFLIPTEVFSQTLWEEPKIETEKYPSIDYRTILIPRIIPGKHFSLDEGKCCYEEIPQTFPISNYVSFSSDIIAHKHKKFFFSNINLKPTNYLTISPTLYYNKTFKHGITFCFTPVNKNIQFNFSYLDQKISTGVIIKFK